MDIGFGPPRGKAAVAWLLPWLGTAAMWAVSSALEDGVGFVRSCAIAFLVGALLGVGWYLIYPRPLARRLVAPLALTSVWVLVSGIVGEFVPDLSGSVLYTPLGIITGLAFTELRSSRRQSPTAAHQPARAASPS